MQDRIRVVVTGMGVVAPNGRNIATFRDALYHGISGITFIPELERLNFGCQVGGIPNLSESDIDAYFTKDERMGVNEVVAYGCIAAVDAYRDAGLQIPDRKTGEPCWETGAIIGTGIGGMDTISDTLYPAVTAGKVKRMGSAIVEQTMASAVSARLGGMLGLGNQVTTNSSACSTGTEAIVMAADRIRAGLARRMVAGGAEGTSPYSWAGFDSMRVLCRGFNETPRQASRPMSATASGFVPSGGGGMLVLESLDTALERGADIYAEILGGCINSGGMRQGGSMTAPNDEGVQRCIRSAVADARIQPEAIDYINGHLTATFADSVELMNWSRALEVPPEHMPPVNATKSLIGHSLGAAGAIECIATILQMKDGFIHGSMNCENLHPDAGRMASSIVRETKTRNIQIAAKAGFGFGDVNSCIIFKNAEAM